MFLIICTYITIVSLLNWANHNPEVECPLMMRWVIGLIPLGRPFKLSFQLVLHNWCKKSPGMYYPVCGAYQRSIAAIANWKE